MSTRSTTHFHDGNDKATEAIIYRHSDGYPSGAGADLLDFVEQVRKATPDTRFSDPSYLAAKYVVFLARIFARLDDAPNPSVDRFRGARHHLNFLSVGVVKADPLDIEYRYHVYCDGKPTMTVQGVNYGPGDEQKFGPELSIPDAIEEEKQA